MDRKTKIICTIGPASESKEMMRKLVDTGMDIIRLNFSHGDYEEQGNRIKNIREVVKETGKSVAILLDTKGPEIRLGDFENGQESYEKGEIVTIVREKILGTHEKFHIQCPEVFDDVEVGGTILMDDGKLRVTILEKGEGMLKCRVENPHTLKSRKGCNVPGVKLSMPFISEKDDADREILEVADGVMVARGDLGVDVSLELVPIYQKRIIAVANEVGKPVVTATHMLESMQGNPRPTRAEASDVANAILDGTDAIMLSGESAAGLYPIEAVATMVKIAKAIEPIIPYHDRLKKAIKSCRRTKNDAIGISVADTSAALNVAGIIAFTQSGTTARRIAKFRPQAPILAVTFDERTQRSLAANWGVTAICSETVNTRENEASLARNIAMSYGIHKGETIIVVAGYPTGCGATNTMKIIEV